MKNLMKIVMLVLLTGMFILPLNAQEEKTVQEDKKVEFKVSGDVVSSYVWRGAYNAGASVQPTLGLGIGGFSFTAWGSKEISGPHKEIDFTAAYSFGKVGIAVTDYWWDGEKQSGDVNNKYFHFDNHDTGHRLEAAVNYTISEKFPLNVAWYTMFWGADKRSNDKQNYSSYVELNYPFSVKGVDLTATMGVSPYDSALYGVSSFAVCNLALGATKEIKISKSFSLPIFARVIFDPAHEDAHVVFGFTLR